MKALILSNKFPYPAKDGSSIAIMSMIHLMLKADMEVHMLSLNTLKHWKDPSSFEKDFPEVKLTSIKTNTNITPLNTLINLLDGQPFHISRFYDQQINTALIEILKKDEFDIVQFEGIFMGPYLETVRLHSNAKCVVRLHNVEHVIWERQVKAEQNPLKKWYLSLQAKRLKAYEKKKALEFDGLIPISEIDGQFFRHLSESIPIESVACAIDLNKYKFIPSENSDFFFIGALDWMPNKVGIDWFLKEVWPKVHEALPKVKFHLAGRAFPDDIRQLNIPGVHIVGEVDRASKFFEDHGIFIVPLLSGSGIRIKLIEALAYGKAIISTPVGAEGIETNSENMILSEHADNMAKEMIDLHLDVNRKKEMEAHARKTAESYYAESKLSEELKNFFLSLP